MTTPNEEPGFYLRMIYDELRGINGKLDGHSERLAGLEAWKLATDREIGDIKSSANDKTKSLSTARIAVWTVVGSVVGGGAFQLVSTFIH